MALAAEGLPDHEIAGRLFLSLRTHIQRAMVRRPPALVRLGRRRCRAGLVQHVGESWSRWASGLPSGAVQTMSTGPGAPGIG